MKIFVMTALLVCLLPLLLLVIVAHDDLGFGISPFDVAYTATLAIMALMYITSMYLILQYGTFNF